MDEEPSDAEIYRAISAMKTGKAAGEDGFSAEYLKYGGDALRGQVYAVVRQMWNQAIEAPAGREGKEWPQEWNIGLVVPLWKRKGLRTDKNTWRGITLLSVGSKLMARVVASRASRWTDPWLHEAQTGFRRGRGTDDIHQVARRIVEETTSVRGEDMILFRMFDIEKAYPRVCKDALWRIMEHKGCGAGFIRVCQALHERTAYKVRIHGGTSTPYTPDKGLREGCPSSPPPYSMCTTTQ
jgi:hypothetical protein